MSVVVPETPERGCPGNRESASSRRSLNSRSKSRRSAIVQETPGTPISSAKRKRPRSSLVRAVEESLLASTTSGDDHEDDVFESQRKRGRIAHPLFPSRQEIESEKTFVQYVGATQELTSTRVEDKVKQWLKTNEYPSKTESPPDFSRKGSPNFSPDGFREFILSKLDSKDPSVKPSTPKGLPSKSKRRTSKIFSENPVAKKRLSVTTPTEASKTSESGCRNVSLVVDSDEINNGIVRVRNNLDPDFSSESGKALLAEYQKTFGQPQDSPSNTCEEQKPSIPEDKILEGIVAFVEVRTGHDNRTSCVQDQLRKLGATVSDRLRANVTHMIFKDGTLSNYKKAKKLGIPIVSVTWIEACRQNNCLVPEEKYPTVSKERYESPGLFPKIRKAKSMQPKSEEEWKEYMEKKFKKKKKIKNDLKCQKEENETLETQKVKYPIPSDYYESPNRVNKNAMDDNSDKDSVMQVIAEIRAAGLNMVTPPLTKDTAKFSATSPCSSEELNTPLARRIAMRFYGLGLNQQDSPRNCTLSSNKCDTSSAKHQHPFLQELSKLDDCARNTGSNETFDRTPVGNGGCESIELKNVSYVRSESCSEKEEVDSSRSNKEDTRRRSRIGKSKIRVSSNSEGEEISDLNLTSSDLSRSKKKIDSSSVEKQKGIGVSRKSEIPKNIKGRKGSAQIDSPVKVTRSSKRRSEFYKTKEKNDASQSEIQPVQDKEKSPHQQDSTTVQVKRQKRHLFTQRDILCETATDSPAIPLSMPVTKYIKGKAKIVRHDNGEVFVKPPAKKMKTGTKCTDNKPRPTSIASCPAFSERRYPFRSRKSSLDFVKTIQRKDTKESAVTSTVVLTSCDQEDVDVLQELIVRLGGGLKYAKKVDERTSHVICCDPPRRTLNLLRGLLRGCWLLSKRWIYSCLEAGTWVDEEPFELTSFSVAVKNQRLQRLAFGENGLSSKSIFDDCGLIFFSKHCKATVKDLNELASLAGAQVTRSVRKADVLVGEPSRNDSVNSNVDCVSEKWFFDSLQHARMIDKAKYILQAN